jgi:hypothetical protein
MNRHCWKCGTEWTISGQPGRGEQCPSCRSDLRVCLNCLNYDPVQEKNLGTFCEWFELAKREFKGAATEDDRASKARDELKRLFGD